MQNLSDRALRERIIGAVVLVVVAILVVPMFLDGSADDQETVTTSVTLPGQNSQDRTQTTIVLNRDRSEPVPPTHTPKSSEPEVTVALPPPATETPTPKPVAVTASAEETSAAAKESARVEVAAATNEVSSTGMWAVQLGSFSDQTNAERLAASLRDQGYAAFLSQLNSGGEALHRVRIGPQKDRDSAESIAAQLTKSGHKGQVVPHP